VSESQAKVVIAADSRTIGEDWKAHDDTTKITVLSPTLVFAACGVIVDNSRRLAPNDRFVAAQVARDVLSKFKPDPMESQMVETRTGQIALNWSFEMSAKMRRGIATELDIWLFGRKAAPTLPFVQGIFAGVEPDGSLSVVTAIVDYIPPSRGAEIAPLARPFLTYVPLSDKYTLIEPWGMKEVAYSYIHGNSAYSIEIRNQIVRPVSDFDERLPYALVERTIAEVQPIGPGKPKGVGGKIDVVELKRGGHAKWLCRKSECQFPTPQSETSQPKPSDVKPN
jgi:hypothetical protein